MHKFLISEIEASIHLALNEDSFFFILFSFFFFFLVD